MKPWNFASAKIAERRFCRRYINGELRVIAAVFAALLFVSAGLSAARVRINHTTSDARARLLQAQQHRSESRVTMQATEKTARGLEWQDTLADVTGRWIEVLNAVARASRDDIWLTLLQTSSDRPRMIMEGTARSYQSLTLFLDRLRANPDFADITLTDSKASGDDGGTTVSFSLDVHLAFPAATEQPAETPARDGVPSIAGA
jgi:hypothetical protein